MARDLRVRIIGDSSSFERALGRTSTTADRFARTSRRLGIGLATVLGGGLAASVKLAGDFEQSLNTMQAVSGATAKQMERVSRVAKQLGADISLPATSAKDAADAMTELAKGGLNVRQSMAAARGVLQLSAAAQIENAEAATITARALNAFKLEGREAVRVADLLAASANASTAEIGDIAQAMQQAAASAHQAGVPIEDLTTAIGLMANAGVVGSDAGTSLKTMLIRLIPSTDKARRTMRRLGIITEETGNRLFDQQGRFVGLEKAIGIYNQALSKLTPKQRQQAIQTIFGTDAMRAANIVLGGGVKSFKAMKEATTEQGAAAALAAAKMKGFKGAMEAFRSALETLAITFGTQLLPILTEWLQKLSRGATYLEQHKTLTKGLVIAVGALATALVAASVAQAALNLAVLANPYVAATVALIALGAALVAAYRKSKLLFTIMVALVSPIAAVAFTIARHWGTIKGAAGAAIGFIQARWRALLAAFGPLGAVIARAIGLFNRLRSVGVAVFGALTSAAATVSSAVARIVGWVSSAISAIGRLSSAIRSIPRPSLPSFPDIPGLASGVQGFAGGLAVVGERGPELVNLPRGSDVIPLSRGTAATHVHFHGPVYGSPAEIARMVKRELAFGDLRNS